MNIFILLIVLIITGVFIIVMITPDKNQTED